MPIPVRAQEKASGVRPKCDVGKTAGIMTPASRISPPTAMGRRDPVYDTAPWHGEEGWEKREKADQQANLKGTVSVRKRVKTRGNAHNRKGHVKRNGKENDAENHGIT